MTRLVSRTASRRLDAYSRDFGAGYERLPWNTPREAARALTCSQRKGIARFRARVSRAWLSAEPARALAAAFAELDPASRVAIYPGAPPGGPRWSFQSVGGELGSEPFKCHELLPAVRQYKLDGNDPFADRPVVTVPIMRANVGGVLDPTEFVETLLVPNDAIQQLRMVTYDQHQVGIFAGWYRTAASAPFGLAEHALLFALRPTFLAWSRLARAIGPSPLGDSALVDTLRVLPLPALLVRNGVVVYANRLGVAHHGVTREWLRAGRPVGYAQSTPLAPGGFAVDLVLPHVAPVAPSVSALELSHRYGLTRAEARLALRLAAGKSVRDAASELDMAYETARTHLKRVYEKLDVNRQGELVAKILRR